MSKFLLKSSLLFGLMIMSQLLFAQTRNITGTVKSNSNEAIIGATVLVKGTQNGTSTDSKGKFAIALKSGQNTVTVSAIGFVSREVTVGSDNSLSITLQDDESQLNEVTVTTALGIKRSQKSLGYTVQEVKGTTISEAKEVNVVNALSGKVAGLQITRSGNGPGGSSKITLRGNNSLTGNNQPLIVIDGTPMDNFTGMTNNDYYNPSLDMGNGLSDLNADDIENVSVLKGPSAAALYGTRAGNGVILITTKSGKSQKGLGISFSSSLGVENLLSSPKMQNDFAQGTNGAYDKASSESWGPKITGQNAVNSFGQTVPLKSYDNIGNFFNSGLQSTQTISFQQQFKSTSLYTSYTRFDNKSMIPGAKLNRDNILARTVTKFGKDDRWSIDTKVQYNHSEAYNRPQGGPRTDNSFYSLYILPRNIDISKYSNGVDQFQNMIWWNTTSDLNPYWSSKYNLNNDIRDRFLLNGSLKYQFTDWLVGEVKGGSDIYTTNTESKTYGGSPLTRTGRYGLGKSTFRENNYSAMFTATKNNLFGKFGGNVMLGGNLMSQKSASVGGSAGELAVPNLFSVNNSTGNPSVSQALSARKINSLYGSLQLNYDDYLFLDITGRNDWSSTLSLANRSFFYPSFSLSYVFSDMITKNGGKLPNWFSFGKLRASNAQVGNDLAPYQLYNTYTIGKDPNGNTVANKDGVLYDPTVRSELIKSYELGTELRFFQSRVGLDISLYKTNATRQLINLPMDPLSGYSSKKINAGDIENKGIEMVLDGKIFNKEDKFNWNVSVNYSINRNIVNSLYEGVSQYQLGGFDNISVRAVAGEKYGEIYGSKLLRVEDKNSPYFGKLIVSDSGLPQINTNPTKLGNQQANSLLGVTNSFSYKGVTFSFLVDARFGGQIFSGTLAAMQRVGTAAETVINGNRTDFVVDGVIKNADNTYTANSTAVSPQLYWKALTAGNLGSTDLNLYDATNVRIRNIQLVYVFPKKWLKKTPIQRASFGISANNVWLMYSKMKGMDPESSFATGSNATGFENGSSPTTRTVLFNLNVGF